MSLENATCTKITSTDIETFLEKVAKPFISHLESNISSRFTSSGNVIAALSIFDPRKVPSEDSEDLSCYGNDAVSTLLAHYGRERSAETLDGEETVQEAMISTDVTIEWKTFRRYMSKKSQNNLQSQLKDLVSNDMMKTMFPNLSTLASISLSIPVATASVERSFSQMKLIKTRLRSQLSDTSLSHLMKIAIESPDKLTNPDLQAVVDIWNRKSRRIPV